MTAKKTDELFVLYKQFAEAQRRQQIAVVVILSAVMAIATALCTWITWESVATRREANDLQRQLIELQSGRPSTAALTPRSDAHRTAQASAEPRRVQSRAHSSAQGSTGSRQTAIEGKALPPALDSNSLPTSRNWSVGSALLDRPGRQ
jgi:hypothetical protein